jgi:hypothetical protein
VAHAQRLVRRGSEVQDVEAFEHAELACECHRELDADRVERVVGTEVIAE